MGGVRVIAITTLKIVTYKNGLKKGVFIVSEKKYNVIHYPSTMVS